jgi:hypothetical protein
MPRKSITCASESPREEESEDLISSRTTRDIVSVREYRKIREARETR